MYREKTIAPYLAPDCEDSGYLLDEFLAGSNGSDILSPYDNPFGNEEDW